MESKTAYLFDPYSTTLPPTHNFLDNRQRNRLVRSTRKLEAVLGTSLRLAEPEKTDTSLVTMHSTIEPRPAASSRRVSLIPAASVASVEQPLRKRCSMKLRCMAKRRTTSGVPGPLVLRLDTLPRMAEPCQPPSPSTPTTSSTASLASPSTPSTPNTPSTAQTPTTPSLPSAAELRRKRIAKLSRTLGEIIPPHLIEPCAEAPKTAGFPIPRLPLSPIAALPRPRGRAKRSMSMDYGRRGAPSMARPSTDDEPWRTVQKTWVGEWNRTDIREVQDQLRTLRA
ncbi:hypothetical protein EIP86_002166 [Pleurotus ostreatoroseus]|nr:hypothetical protein EIP86_002166 [Pleurotus ostreatoroseus]